VLRFAVIILTVAIVIYLAVRLMQSGGPRPLGGGRAVRRPVAPDDDPDFLRDLDKRRRDQSDS
jgi:hypothetical protein